MVEGMGFEVSADDLTISMPKDPVLRELFLWWIKTAAEDFARTVPKALEYGGTTRPGSADLRIIGTNLAELMGWADVSEAVTQELGCWFYLQGKSARLISDYQHQRPGKADTWFDACVYGMMARRLQEVGRWP